MAGSAGSMESMASAFTAMMAAIRATNCLKPIPAFAGMDCAANAVMEGTSAGRTRPRGAASLRF